MFKEMSAFVILFTITTALMNIWIKKKSICGLNVKEIENVIKIIEVSTNYQKINVCVKFEK